LSTSLTVATATIMVSDCGIDGGRNSGVDDDDCYGHFYLAYLCYNITMQCCLIQ